MAAVAAAAAEKEESSSLFITKFVGFDENEIAKLDDEQRIVKGIASSEALDSQKEVVSLNAIKKALSGYWGNIREMHQPSAVGTTIECGVEGDALRLVAKIVDDMAWKKVKEGVYKGFSIGGKRLDSVMQKSADGTPYRLITDLDLTEISLVDRPANPEAKIQLWKMEESPVAGSTTTNNNTTNKLLAKARTAKPKPDAIVQSMLALHNQYVTQGDSVAAQMVSHAIALVQAAEGDNEDDNSEEEEGPLSENSSGEGSGSSDGSNNTPITMSAKTGDIAKRKSGIQKVIKSLSDIAGIEAIVAKSEQGSGGTIEQQQPAAFDYAVMADAVAKSLNPTFDALAELFDQVEKRLDHIERTPRAGGPATMSAGQAAAAAVVVNKGLTPAPSQHQKLPTVDGQQKAAATIVKGENAILEKNLRRLIATETNPVRKMQYKADLEKLLLDRAV